MTTAVPSDFQDDDEHIKIFKKKETLAIINPASAHTISCKEAFEDNIERRWPGSLFPDLSQKPISYLHINQRNSKMTNEGELVIEGDFEK